MRITSISKFVYLLFTIYPPVRGDIGGFDSIDPNSIGRVFKQSEGLVPDRGRHISIVKYLNSIGKENKFEFRKRLVKFRVERIRHTPPPFPTHWASWPPLPRTGGTGIITGTVPGTRASTDHVNYFDLMLPICRLTRRKSKRVYLNHVKKVTFVCMCVREEVFKLQNK